MDLTTCYYSLNNIWYYGNIAMMPLFLISMIARFKHPSIHTKLPTDHLARICLIFTVLFYIADVLVKHEIDGGETICQKALFIHHVASLVLIPPLVVN